MSSDRAAPFSIKSGAQLPFSTLSAFSRSLLEHKKKSLTEAKSSRFTKILMPSGRHLC